MRFTAYPLVWALLILPAWSVATANEPTANEASRTGFQTEWKEGTAFQASRSRANAASSHERFGLGGPVDDLDLRERRIVIGDELYYLDPNVRVYTRTLSTALPRQIGAGDFVLFNARQSGGNRLVTEIWMAPDRVRREFMDREDDD